MEKLETMFKQLEQYIRFREKIVDLLREFREKLNDDLWDYNYDSDIMYHTIENIDDKIITMIWEWDEETREIIDKQQGVNVFLNYNN